MIIPQSNARLKGNHQTRRTWDNRSSWFNEHYMLPSLRKRSTSQNKKIKESRQPVLSRIKFNTGETTCRLQNKNP
jgi:hypothetical protein